VTLLINGIATPIRNSLQNWGDLVVFLDNQLAASQDVVTDVRLDGVDEPAFRDPGLSAQPMSTFSLVEVETGEPQVLARRCLGEAASAVGELRLATRDTADGFRLANVEEAQEGLHHVSEGLVMVLRIVAAAGLALRRELDSVDGDGRSIGTLSNDLDAIVQVLLEAQRNEDWIQVADILEYDLNPILSGWHSALASVAAA
jgi:hypothetical protein